MRLKNSVVLITGGTGSLGQELAKQILAQSPKKVIIYSRNECNQVVMRRKFDDSRIRFFIGDVRDVNRLIMALKNVDYVIHSAALKGVDVCAYNPFEAIQTNIIGAQNVIDACIECNVEKVVAISSDKAANPVNLYGASKLCADKLFIASNAYSGKSGTKFSVVRFGNFENSNGSVLPYWRELVENGSESIPVTDPRMTRFHITIDNAAEFVLRVLRKSRAGEIWCPKMDTYSLLTLAKENYPDKEIKVIGKRPGEKLHEDMIVSDDADRTYETDFGFITLPEFKWIESCKPHGSRKVKYNFQYRSGDL